MTLTERRLKTLEDDMMHFRVIFEQWLPSLQHSRPAVSPKDRMKLLDLFGAWDGEIDEVLEELSARRERRGRLE